jgi:hypothetical protein
MGVSETSGVFCPVQQTTLVKGIEVNFAISGGIIIIEKGV